MLFSRFNVIALIVFESSISGAFLARRLSENRGLVTKTWTKNVLQRDALGEIAPDISSNEIIGGQQNGVEEYIDGDGADPQTGVSDKDTTGVSKASNPDPNGYSEALNRIGVSNDNPSGFEVVSNTDSSEYVQIPSLFSAFRPETLFSAGSR